ncbi:MAG: UDP-N-acetylmuramate dehydrogenase [Candidatus Omnitrophica bacterium]|nr:UDP-N-acetylmuramate dehydrogenase [Candidatus Omnitrophota bacterium]
MNCPKDLTCCNIKPFENLSSHTSFKIGGRAALWAEPKDPKGLKNIFLYAKKNNVRTFIIGGGTNILASDRGFDGIAVHLGAPHFKKVKMLGSVVRAGAGYSMSALVRLCCKEGLSGLESLVGIPGTVGGAVYMNAGGWSSPLYKNIGDYIASIKVMDYSGNIKTIKKGDIKFGYRSSNLSSYIILEAVLKLGKEDSASLTSRCSKFLEIKKEKQVLDMPSAGCVFKNPENFQFTTGQMIDTLGLKGMRSGGAQISPKHANFIVNRSGATSDDVFKLIDIMRKKVMDNYKIALELEIKII